MTASHPFFDLLTTRVPPSAWDWWEGTGELGACDRSGFLAAFSVAGRHLGRSPVALKQHEITRLSRAGVEPALTCWGQDDLGRAALLLRAAEILPSSDYDELIHDCYAVGDHRDRESLLRIVPFLPRCERFDQLVAVG